MNFYRDVALPLLRHWEKSCDRPSMSLMSRFRKIFLTVDRSKGTVSLTIHTCKDFLADSSIAEFTKSLSSVIHELLRVKTDLFEERPKKLLKTSYYKNMKGHNRLRLSFGRAQPSGTANFSYLLPQCLHGFFFEHQGGHLFFISQVWMECKHFLRI